mgnify:CR=1 FL=1
MMSEPSARVRGTITDLANQRSAASGLRVAARRMRRVDGGGFAAEMDLRAETIEATVMAVTVPCLLCHGGFSVAVLVGSGDRPAGVLCEDCDAKTSAEANHA